MELMDFFFFFFKIHRTEAEVVRKLPGATNLINISTRMKQHVAFPAAAAPTVVPVRNRLVLKFKRCFCQILRNKDSWRILSSPVWRMWTFHELTEQSDSAVKRPESCRLLNAPHPFTFTFSRNLVAHSCCIPGKLDLLGKICKLFSVCIY